MNTTSLVLSVRLSPRTKEVIDRMVERGFAINRSDALRIVIAKGIAEVESK